MLGWSLCKDCLLLRGYYTSLCNNPLFIVLNAHLQQQGHELPSGQGQEVSSNCGADLCSSNSRTKTKTHVIQNDVVS